jgi:hypothetical protein
MKTILKEKVQFDLFQVNTCYKSGSEVSDTINGLDMIGKHPNFRIDSYEYLCDSEKENRINFLKSKIFAINFTDNKSVWDSKMDYVARELGLDEDKCFYRINTLTEPEPVIQIKGRSGKKDWEIHLIKVEPIIPLCDDEWRYDSVLKDEEATKL